MKIWKTIVVDDEPYCRQDLTRMLSQYSFIQVIDEADNVEKAITKIIEQSPDLVFLDINLGVQSGFDLLEKVSNNFQVIFVTAYEEFALRAFKVNALDYLLKPVHPERLKESIERLGNPFKYDSNYSLKLTDKILIDQFNTSKFISVKSINYIQAQGDYSMVHTNEKVRGLIHHTLKKWNERLPSKQFVQVHRSYIVNIDYIEKLIRKENNTCEIVLKGNQGIIPVSRNNTKSLRQTYAIK